MNRRPDSDPSARLTPIRVSKFDLEKTLHSGQAFGWQRALGGHVGTVDGVPLFLRQEPPKPGCESSKLWVTAGCVDLARRYLALDHDLAAIKATFPNDARMREAEAFGQGMRILRQPLWECLVSFISSAQKQVAHIRQIHRQLCVRHGELVGECAGIALHRFPGPTTIARLSEPDLRSLGLGFRAKSVLATARAVAEGAFDLGSLRKLPTGPARRALMTLPGVGAKIANCVLLFALERLEAVPVDVWIARILRESYTRRKMTLPRLEALATRRLGPFAGYAQQYLFHHARNRPRSQSARERFGEKSLRKASVRSPQSASK